MKRSKNPSFVLTLKLNTTPSDEHILADRFFAAFLMKNRLIRYARKKLSAMRQNKEYRSLMAKRKLICDKDDAVSKHRKAEIGKDLARIRMYYGLSEYQFHDWISLQQHRYKKHIDSLTAQKLATAVWRAVEACLFRKGKSIHFQRLDSLLTLEGKNNVSGIRFKDGRLHWSGLVIQPQLRKGDHYAKEALTHRVKYCRIKRPGVRIYKTKQAGFPESLTAPEGLIIQTTTMMTELSKRVASAGVSQKPICILK